MVGFGKKLRERQIPEWEQYYIGYKMMKKKVNHYSSETLAGGKEDRKRVLREFSLMLDFQVERTVLFLLEEQGHLAERLSKLADDRQAAEEQAATPRRQVLLDKYRAVGKDLLQLLHFVEINATGLRKILKKFDKRVGYRLSDEYVVSRSNHPYSQLQQVFKHVGIGAMVGTLSRNFKELKDPRNALSTSIYELPAWDEKEPIIEAIRSAEKRLTNSTNFLILLGHQALLVREDLPTLADEEVGEEEYHLISLLLNLVNAFLYMVNTYIIVPTADKYAFSLGAAPTVCGIIIGSMAVAQLVASVYFSAWSNTSYFRPLVFSSVMLFLGNLCYAVAYDYRSLVLLLVGRLLCGFGSARAVNRRYISDFVPGKSRLKASAGFVSASALGMACGPGLAGLLTFHKQIYGLTFSANTLPGWVMAVGWLIYLLLLWIGFKEPVRDYQAPRPDNGQNTGANQVLSRHGIEEEEGLMHPLLKDSSEKENDSDSNQVKLAEPAASIGEAYRLLTYSVKVQLLIYFMLKFTMEILLSESSVITAHYFQWGSGSVSLFLALLGLTVLPINFVVGTCISNIFEDRQILLFAEVSTCIGVVVSFSYYGLPYSVVQYVCGALMIFVSAEVLEGVNLSLLSKVMSSRLARGTYNGGLLSTEAGTLARVLADVAITLAGGLGASRLLNVTMLPTLFIGVFSVFATLSSYNSLF